MLYQLHKPLESNLLTIVADKKTLRVERLKISA